jgi:hypothetical protein
MYTSYIGLKFLEIYNKNTGNKYSAEEFFDIVMFPLFFDDARHLMTVHGSAFFQPKLEELKPENRRGRTEPQIRFDKLKNDIANAAIGKQSLTGSILVGGPASGPVETTSGQTTSLNLMLTEDELYASWIGNALAARVEGSQCLLLDSEPVLWHLYEGWQVYRNYMKPVNGMEGRQIETWNGYWLAKGSPTKAVSPPQKGTKLDTYPWIEVLARLLEWHNGEVLPAYIFSLGQTNTTYGFINLNLPQVKRLADARFAVKKSILGGEADEALFWEHYKPELSLREVCQLGEIGLIGLRPIDYGKMMEGALSSIKLNDKNRNTFLNIQTWIIAMLNNKSDLKNLATELAKELSTAEKNKGSAPERLVKSNTEISEILDAKGMISFIKALTAFLEKRSEASGVCRSIVDKTIVLPGEQFLLFKALLRFEYVFLKSNN